MDLLKFIELLEALGIIESIPESICLNCYEKTSRNFNKILADYLSDEQMKDLEITYRERHPENKPYAENFFYGRTSVGTLGGCIHLSEFINTLVKVLQR